jgi:hypothetical protein
MARVRQTFPRPQIEDLDGTVDAELAASGVTLRSGQSVAIGVGSRGIDRLQSVVRRVVSWVGQQGAEPFIVPAMGSHGGATAEGQTEVLAEYGITEAEVGAPIRATMETVELPRGDLPVPSFWDKNAAGADATIVINRVKVHTCFHGPYESGLMKMITIGLGKQDQPLLLHERGVGGLRDVMPAVARHNLEVTNVVLGVALVENAYDELCRIRAIPADAIPEEELPLIEYQRTCMPRLPTDDVDVLIVDEMGKNFSGTGMDPNVIGRMLAPGNPEPESPRCKMILVRDLTAATHGNAMGVGLADITTRRLTEQIDWEATYTNLYTSAFLGRGKTPVVAATDAEAMAFAVRGARAAGAALDNAQLRIVRIPNTLCIDQADVSSSVLREIEQEEHIEVLGQVGPLLLGDDMAPFRQF